VTGSTRPGALEQQREVRRAEWALFGLTLIWGATFTVVKNALADSSVGAFLTIRFALATLVGIAISPRAIRHINRRMLLHGGVMGVLLYLGFVFQTEGLRFTTVSNSGFLTGTMVVFVPLFEVAVARSLPKWNHILGVAIVTLGLYLLAAPEIGESVNRGDVLTLGCAIVFAVYMVLLSKVARLHDLHALSILQMGTVTVLGAISLPFGDTPRFDVGAGLIGALVYSAILATLVATIVQTKYQPKTTATKAAIIFTAEPVFAAAFGMALLGERLTLRNAAGAVAILAGLLVSELMGQERRWAADVPEAAQFPLEHERRDA
jgi:drug/metabolite transporter (DMT)-like permease